jgi:ferric-dicitrate binding protein FerR (iron transport regulator)
MTPVGEHDRYEPGVARLAGLARSIDEGTDDGRHAAGRERLLLAVAARERRPRAKWVILAAAAAAIAAAVAVVLARTPARLEYRVAGPFVADGAWLAVEPAGGPLSIRFSDGTELDLGPGSKGQVAEVTGSGARVVLASGVLEARVVHRPGARWAVAAGPYTVEVTGTAFDVGWSGARQELELSLHDGSVVVRGPSLPDGFRVAAGQRLVARAANGEAQLSSLLAAVQPHADAPGPAPAGPAAAGVAQAHAVPAPGAPASGAPPTWSEMLADGNFRGVIDSAEARGIDATLGRASLADVVALADAARYVHERGLAKRGLLAERSRFAGSPEARGAAFVLGRMADDVGTRDEAIRWYDTYLAESPRGPLVAEALGRKLVALAESGDAVGARAVAADYLKRFPQGAHAAYARDHLR